MTRPADNHVHPVYSEEVRTTSARANVAPDGDPFLSTLLFKGQLLNSIRHCIMRKECCSVSGSLLIPLYVLWGNADSAILQS